MSNGIIAKYSFIPWVRQGIAAKITNLEDPLAGTPDELLSERADITVDVQLTADGSASTVSRGIKISGPGDVVGINPKAILRTEPVPGTKNYEENYLPYIEFYEEDFPWRYTPAMPAASDPKLRPWLYLLVLETDTEVDTAQGQFNEPLPYIRVLNTSALPTDGRDAWAFAHVHVNGNIQESGNYVTNFRDQVAENPDSAHSRILSPRNLKASTDYTAFLIPAYETGRLAGLGLDTAGIEGWLPSWGHPGNVDYKFPYYHKWSFSTGTEGDFESLVTKLKPNQLPAEVGMRRLDIQEAADQLNATINEEFTGIGGALRTDWTSQYPFTSQDFEDALRDLVNLQEDLSDGSVTGTDPVITPPLYGRWHALEHKVPGYTGWLRQLNLDPGNRAAAGLGAQVVRQNQETFMEYAWQQVGEILEANRKIGFTELADKVSTSLYQRHIVTQPQERLLSMTATLHSKAPDPNNGNNTLHETIRTSGITRSGISPTMHRMMRPTGKFRKRFPDVNNLVVSKVNDNEVALIVPKAGYADNATYALFFSNSSVNQLSTYTSGSFAAGSQINPFQIINDHLTSYNQVQVVGSQLNMSQVNGTIADTLNPTTAIVGAFTELIDVPPGMIGPSQSQLRHVMAHPVFPMPVYPFLRDISSDYVIPNISQVPDDTICLMIPNLEFIESFMVGMNHEMSRELLWREFPTDQRGTYFRQFWDKSDNPEIAATGDFIPDEANDIEVMGEWSPTSALGSHEVVSLGGQNPPTGASAMVFLLIRGELLRKYPDALIYAQKAVWQKNTDGTNDYDSPRVLDTSGLQGSIKWPQFKASIGEDINFFAFDIDVGSARGSTESGNEVPGWFFVIRERAGKTRFGLDISPQTTFLDPSGDPAAAAWKELTWGHLDATGPVDNLNNIPLSDPHVATGILNMSDYNWGHSSADMANILYQQPVLVAYHGSDMLNF